MNKQQRYLNRKELAVINSKIECETFYNAMFEKLFPSVIENPTFQMYRDNYLKSFDELQNFIEQSEKQLNNDF